LLSHYEDKPLIDPYDIYQHLMDYWVETMQDDCYQIATEGWIAETYRIIVKDNKGREKDKGWACDLIPKSLIVAHYYAHEQIIIDELSAAIDNLAAQQTELEEENSGEEDTFGEFEKINKTTVNRRLKEIKNDPEADEERQLLKKWLDLFDQQSSLKKELKTAETDLDLKAYKYYPILTEEEIKSFVVDEKWLARLDADIVDEVNQISRHLSQQVEILHERYEVPLPIITDHVTSLAQKVSHHLEKMGFSWN